MKVLIIDDEEIIAGMLSDLLEYNGHRVMVANSGADGLFRAKQFCPDIISLDLNMPGMDGFEVLEKLKKDEATRDIPVMIASVNDKEQLIRKGISMGARKFFTKPFSMASFEREITACAV